MTNVECRIEIEEECNTEYKTECTLVPTTRQESRTELECACPKCTKDSYGQETCVNGAKKIVASRSGCKNEVCKSLKRSVTVEDTKEECVDVPVEVCEPLQNEVCDNVVTKKIEKVPRKECKTVKQKVCY